MCYRIRDRWQKSYKKGNTFEIENAARLQGMETFSVEANANNEPKRKGPSTTEFCDVTERTKRRKVEQLRASASAQELSFAAEINARKEGNEDAAKLIHEIMQGSPTRPSKVRKELKDHRSSKPVISYTCDEALSLSLELNLSKSGYQQLRNGAKSKNAKNMYPPYYEIELA